MNWLFVCSVENAVMLCSAQRQRRVKVQYEWVLISMRRLVVTFCRWIFRLWYTGQLLQPSYYVYWRAVFMVIIKKSRDLYYHPSSNNLGGRIASPCGWLDVVLHYCHYYCYYYGNNYDIWYQCSIGQKAVEGRGCGICLLPRKFYIFFSFHNRAFWCIFVH